MIRVRCGLCGEVYGLAEGHGCSVTDAGSVGSVEGSYSGFTGGRMEAGLGRSGLSAPAVGERASTGFDRKAYQREYMRGYMRERRARVREER